MLTVVVLSEWPVKRVIPACWTIEFGSIFQVSSSREMSSVITRRRRIAKKSGDHGQPSTRDCRLRWHAHGGEPAQFS